MSRKPCEVCGAEKADAHHDDYSKPLEIQWLCHSHHMLRHAMLRARGEA
ncbi:gene 26 protein [Burkholderia multivorans CGD2M]|uniref:Gene 26 protein n=1 Tax=Burkholderia multivorans CGD2 TaxID=513052 RepID=B9BX84_9BURK|nr:gene 26 protein [Burkholderia multivorans CGD2]EEE11152.1 gene 26 protein [Burkholderia multivorans CGD2M]